MIRIRLTSLAVLLIVASANADAQSTFGSLLGTVKEPSGAVVPNARVELVNQGTGQVKSTLTNQAGNYQFENLDVGTYRATIEATGFQKIEFTPFQLSARETKRLDANLTLATQQQTRTWNRPRVRL